MCYGEENLVFNVWRITPLTTHKAAIHAAALCHNVKDTHAVFLDPLRRQLALMRFSPEIKAE
jgi:hypothetical protein